MSRQKKETAGKVWIAGAGPGDLSLLTVRTAALLREADVVVYDALVSAEILSQIPPETEQVYVGKRAGNHAASQREIQELLLKEAKAGRQVLRLKGGDPFVFGRGGEELEFLEKEQIPVEVIPGVSSAVAVPAYAGIPVTHRDYASSFHVITGHGRQGGDGRIDYHSLVRLGGTLIFLMGMARLGDIVKGLLDAGMERDMPAAIVENGTAAKQRQVISTLSEIEREARHAQIKAPVVIVVGRVCALADSFAWAQKRPLGGRQFLVTRPRQNSARLAGRLRELGAQVIEMPAICTEEILPNKALKMALDRLQAGTQEEWLAFTSPIGVEIFFSELKREKIDVRSVYRCMGELKVAAIGPGTARELMDAGIFPDLIPEKYDAKSLGMALAKKASSYSHVTVLRAEKGSPELIPPLQAAGLSVDDIPLYRTRSAGKTLWKEKVVSMLMSGQIDAVTFTSASTVRGFVEEMEGLSFGNIHALCIGRQTAAEAEKYQMQIQIAPEASIKGMEDLILREYGNRDKE